MPQPLSCGPRTLVVAGLITVEGILILNINYKQVNIPLRSDSHVPFSRAAQQGSLAGLLTISWGLLVRATSETAPYLLPGAAHEGISLWTPYGLLVQGPNAVPRHMPENRVRAAAGADRLCFVLAQTASLGSRAYKALPNEGKRSWRVIF